MLSDVVSALSADVSPVDSVRADSAFTELEDVTAVPHPPKASDDTRNRLTTAPVSFFLFFFFAFLAEYDAILQLEKTSHIRGFYLYKLATGQIPGKDIVKNTDIIKGLRFQDFH